MSYFPEIHHRQSIRLSGFDYSQAGEYFVTICASERECIFGEIASGKMILNANGEIVKKEWMRTPKIRPNIRLDEFVVMPNHLHGIIIIVGTHDNVPQPNNQPQVVPGRGTQQRAPANRIEQTENSTDNGNAPNPGDETKITVGGTLQRTPTSQIERFGKPTVSSIPTIIRGFKSATTKQINIFRNTPGADVWQRNYFEHVIRDAASFENIRAYIAENPLKWNDDPDNPFNEHR